MHLYFQELDTDYESLVSEVDCLKNRVSKLEKVFNVLKKGSGCNPTVIITTEYFALLS